jgi:hypothetical protein
MLERLNEPHNGEAPSEEEAKQGTKRDTASEAN